jgi:hypothetical protein
MADTMTTNWNQSETQPGEAAHSIAATVADKADEAVGAVGCGMKSVADTLRDRGPEQGVLGTVTSRTAETLDTAGRYLRDEGVTGMAADVTNLIRRNPGPALLLGLGLGFLLAWATKRR